VNDIIVLGVKRNKESCVEILSETLTCEVQHYRQIYEYEFEYLNSVFWVMNRLVWLVVRGFAEESAASKKTLSSSENLATLYQKTLCHNPENHNIK
jgi:hypothetical protein